MMQSLLFPCSPLAIVSQDVPRTAAGAIDYSKDFFGKPAMLTVSGQVRGFYCYLYVIMLTVSGPLPLLPDTIIAYYGIIYCTTTPPPHPRRYTLLSQLQVEAYAIAMSDVYTYGPTFRAEPTHTSRHLAEFWMIEPEIS